MGGSSSNGGVHVGNVAEYNAAGLRNIAPRPAARIRACDEYASMAPFYGPDPGITVVPNAPQDGLDRWAEVQAEVMGWRSYRPIAWSGDSLDLSSALLALPEVADSIRAGAPVIAWGETPELRAFVDRAGADATLCTEPGATAWLDSKASAAGIFREAHEAVGQPQGITVAQQWDASSEADLAEALVAASALGRPLMVKSHLGVGGTGCLRLDATDVSSLDGAKQTIDRIRTEDPFALTYPVLVQVCYERAPEFGDLTIDLSVDAAGAVHVLGAARMLVAGTHYEGCITLDDDDPWSAAMRPFALAVGQIAAREGYRGWFDIDFVRSVVDGLVPLEVNARRTGPTVPMSIREVWSARGSQPVHVAAHDLLPLDRPLSAIEAVDRFHRVTKDTDLVGSAVPTLITGTSSSPPYLGVAVCGATSDEADQRLQRFATRLNAGVAR